MSDAAETLRTTTLAPLALVPCMGTRQHHVMRTGGCKDPARWIHGSLAGQMLFDSLDDADQTAKSQGHYLRKNRDFHEIVRIGGLHDDRVAAHSNDRRR